MAKTVEQAVSQAAGGLPSSSRAGMVTSILTMRASAAQDGIQKRDWTGEQLGVEAARVANHILLHPIRSRPGNFQEDNINFRVRLKGRACSKSRAGRPLMRITL